MPAAAVIPAPRVYIKVVAVKELVVVSPAEGAESPAVSRGRDQGCVSPFARFWGRKTFGGGPLLGALLPDGLLGFTLKKLGCSKQAEIALNT